MDQDRRGRARGVGGGYGVLGQHGFRVQAQKLRRAAHESAVKDAAGQAIPMLGFQRVEEARADARGRGNFFERDAAHLPLSAQMYAEAVLCGGLVSFLRARLVHRKIKSG